MTAGRAGCSPAIRWRAALLGLAVLLRAWSTASGESTVTPDRPDVTNSTETVPLGSIQVETGVGYEASSSAGSGVERRAAWVVTLRAGLSDRLEVRLESEPLVHLRASQEDTGSGDVCVGLKYRFLDSAEGRWWPALAVQPFMKLPTAGVPIGSGRPDYGVLALASVALPGELDLDVNAGVVVVGQRRPSGYLMQALASASLARRLTERLSLYGEVFFTSRGERAGRDAVGVDAGVIYLVTPRVALDAAVETRVYGPGPDYGVRGGISVRFGGR